MTQDCHNFLSVAVQALVSCPKPEESADLEEASVGNVCSSTYVLMDADLKAIDVSSLFICF